MTKSKHVYNAIHDNEHPATDCEWGECRGPAAEGLRICVKHAIKAYMWVAERNPVHEEYLRGRLKPPTPTPSEPRAVMQFTGGYVYAMSLGNLVKIGFSTNPTRRAREVPNDGIIGAMEGTPADEKDLHAKFRAHRHHREWFRQAPEVMDWIAANMKPWPPQRSVNRTQVAGETDAA